MRDTHSPIQTLPVFDGPDFAVSAGANLGDGLTFAEDMMLDDVYRLADGAQPLRLSLHSDGGQFKIAESSEIGTPGAVVFLDCALTLMSDHGGTADALVLVELEPNGLVAGSYLLPLAALEPRVEYALVGIDTETARQKLAQIACVSFSRGTHITMGNGAQIPIEALSVGDPVLTRHSGVQHIRWIGMSTARAVGEFAPVRIRAGTLNNARDLIVSPDHRLFVYQRSDQIGAGRSELLVRARHLVNEENVTRVEGGFVDYFQLLFDDHQIVYAEGIAAESFLIDDRTSPAVPLGLVGETPQMDIGAAGLDVGRDLLDRPNVTDLLRRASAG